MMHSIFDIFAWSLQAHTGASLTFDQEVKGMKGKRGIDLFGLVNGTWERREIIVTPRNVTYFTVGIGSSCILRDKVLMSLHVSVVILMFLWKTMVSHLS